jgi:hypothetical protein
MITAMKDGGCDGELADMRADYSTAASNSEIMIST